MKASLMLMVFFCVACRDARQAPPPAVSKEVAQESESADSVKKEAEYELRYFINSGFYDSLQVIEGVCDLFEKIDTSWLAGVAMREYRKRQVEQASWPAMTDFDRLAAAFDRLNEKGIVALHNAGNTTDDGEVDARNIRASLRPKRLRGYCCYDTQNIEALIDGSENLYIAFGDFHDNYKVCALVGKEVNEQLNAVGFATVWDHGCKTRIMIRSIKWQKRFGNENSSYEHAISLLRKYKG